MGPFPSRERGKIRQDELSLAPRVGAIPDRAVRAAPQIAHGAANVQRRHGRGKVRAMKRDCLVVGAGVQGLCTAFWLVRAGCPTTVVERFGPGHEFGSSHGRTRITRSSYDEPDYVQLAALAHARGWPTLEAALGMPLRLRTPGVFFGPPTGLFADYLRTTLQSGANVHTIDVAAARRRFPLLAFDESHQVLIDDTAAVVLAATTMAGLRDWLAAAGVRFLWHTTVAGLQRRHDRIAVATDRGELVAARVVVAAGAGGDGLAADAAPAPATVLHQQVGYFDVDAEPAATRAGVFPVWACIGASARDFTYGLPDVGDTGLKAARHRTEGKDQVVSAPPPIDDAALLALACERFAAPVRGLRRSEPCLYTMLPAHRLVVARSRTLPAVVRVAACSGHAFKFAPELGRRAAAMVLDVEPEAECFGVASPPTSGDNEHP